jgi:hypothetical protein
VAAKLAMMVELRLLARLDHHATVLGRLKAAAALRAVGFAEP